MASAIGIASYAALLSAAACVSGETLERAGVDASGGGTTAGTGGSGQNGGNGATSSGGNTSGTGGTVATGGETASGGAPGGSGGVSTGGTVTGTGGQGGSIIVAGSGGTGTGGASTGGASTGGAGGSAGKACVDVEPPPDPDWPEATCLNWATETSECAAEWFASYCDVSCGRCVPPGGTGGSGGSGGSTVVDCSGEPQVSGGNGYATRYWDCCQPHCAQFNGHRCSQNGTSVTGSSNSACSGGDAFACYDEAPRRVSDCLSYGHIAKANPNCGGCYRIQFTGEGQHNVNDPGSRAIRGKQMIVKVTNTGGDVAQNQFDLMIPGGGVGQFNACSRQWGTSDLGAQYGGFLTECSGTHQQKKDCVRQECMKIPSGQARDGCLWFVDWFEVADNPKFTSQSTNCPF